ncbi:MAG: hypothetical protein KME50_07405 [Nostoc desertorum CM1-VF14]|jgi:hypothetical protein|nr:hypothetical protein [Nostoc desertorum CM1-VF14]
MLPPHRNSVAVRWQLLQVGRAAQRTADLNRGLKAKRSLIELNQAAGLTRQIKERKQ